MGGGTIGDAPAAPKAKPRILLPPRGSVFANGSGPGFSPGPASLVSSLFPEQGRFSFSQLLAGAMASPLATAQPQPQPESPGPSFMVPPGLSPTGFLNSPEYFSPLQSSFGMSHQQALAHVTAQAALYQSSKQMQTEFQHSSSKHPLPSANNSSQTPENLKLESISESSHSGKNTGDKPASDGYNWRKYGQKHVKASECPRSYYKCTHLNCPVKKKVERSSDGRVSEIMYKGEHNHDLPMPNKRGKDSCVLDKTNMASEGWIEIDGLKEVRSESENIQTAAEMVSEHYRDSSNNHYKEDTAAVVIVDKGEDEEPIAKKRSLDIELSRPASSHQAVSEPKIVLQTRSEVDLLDDGYKWRKYGQKVVKGNPHPRSYYRCTYAGCNVRKHVERASTDPNAVVTTYEGKHNHDIPTGRHSIRSSAQQLKTQKKGSKNPLLYKEIDYGDKRHITMTLQPKEHIAA